jgi:hypothetical protein
MKTFIPNVQSKKIPQLSREVRDFDTQQLVGWIVREDFSLVGRSFVFQVYEPASCGIPRDIDKLEFDPETGRVVGPPECVSTFRSVHLPWNMIHDASTKSDVWGIGCRPSDMDDLRKYPGFVEYKGDA